MPLPLDITAGVTTGHVDDHEEIHSILGTVIVDTDVSTTPGASKVVQADALGDIDPTWLPDTSVIRVSEPPPMMHVSATGDNAFDGRWDRPKLTVASALTALASGGEMRVGAGTFEAETLALVNGLTVKGIPGETTIKLPNSSTSYIALATNKADVVIEDIIFDLNKANTTNGGSDTSQMALYFLASSTTGIKNCHVRRCKVINGHQLGMRLNASISPPGTNPLQITVEDCEITGCNRGLRAIRGTDVKLIKNRVYSNTFEGLNCLGGLGDLIQGNRCYLNGQQGIVVTFQGDSNNLSQNARILGNNCYHNGTDSAGNLGWGINIATLVREFACVGNVCHDNYQGGIAVDVFPSGVTDVQDTFGTVVGNVCSGFLGVNASHGIQINGVDTLTATGNVCDGARQSGMHVNGRSVAIAGNTLTNNGAYGLSLTQGSGASTPAQGQHRIGLNIFDGNVSGTINEAAALAGLNQYATISTTVSA